MRAREDARADLMRARHRLSKLLLRRGARNYRTAAVFQETLAPAGARHIVTPPYTPRWNGKAERFIQTMKNEWAYAHE